MKKDLVAKYPKIFQSAYGYPSTDEGWDDLLDVLCGHIQWHIDQRIESLKYYEESVKKGTPWDRKPELVEQVVASQVKEKFAGLRFYFDGGDDYTQGLVDMAEAMSYRICEFCGEKGKTNNEGWLITLCDPCRAKRLAERSQGI